MGLALLAMLWYATVAVCGLASWGLIRRLGVGAGSGWAVARATGLVVSGWAGWMAGWAGWLHWWLVVPGVLVVLALLGWRRWHRAPWRMIVGAEVIGVAAFIAVAVLRFPQMSVAGTEKPMDLAILSMLLRPGTFPPADPWLAGTTLPYYYWGFIPWIFPARLLGLAPDVVYNLLVPTIAAVTAQAAWALARAVGGSRRAAWLASFLAILAGTPDSWRQLLNGVTLRGIDLWQSSRGIAGTITEFPLFTFHLGDLHPHVLSLPLALVALFFACSWGRELSPVVRVVATAILYGAAAASNPWIAVPLGLGVLLLAVAGEEGFATPWRVPSRWLEVVAAGALGWILFVPFWIHFAPVTSGLGWVGAPSAPAEMVLYLGAMLAPAVIVASLLASRLGGFAAARRQLFLALWVLAVVAVSVVAGRAVLTIAAGSAALFLYAMVGGGQRRARPAWGLTVLALLLVAFVEVAYIRDPYVGELYRMNTVFKATSLAFALLAVASPVLLQWLRRRRRMTSVAVAVLVVAAGLPHLAAVTLRIGPAPASWGGLLWMQLGEREAASWLRRQPPGTVIVEAVGDAYSDAARMSVASGVPTALGWENHERVWRGDAVGPELMRRRRLIQRVYGGTSVRAVRDAVAELGATLVVVGSIEEQQFPDTGRIVEAAGEVVFRAGKCTVVRVP